MHVLPLNRVLFKHSLFESCFLYFRFDRFECLMFRNCDLWVDNFIDMNLLFSKTIK
jgi:hypothetical protein